MKIKDKVYFGSGLFLFNVFLLHIWVGLCTIIDRQQLGLIFYITFFITLFASPIFLTLSIEEGE